MSERLVMTGTFRGFTVADTQVTMLDADPHGDEQRRIDAARRQAVDETDRRWSGRLEQERQRIATQYKTLAGAFDRLVDDMEARITTQLIDMSLRLAEIIVRTRLPNREMVQALMREILDPVSDLQGAAVRVHPDEVAFLTEKLGGAGAADARIRIVSDPSLKPGDLLVESRNGYFDARLAERFSLLREKLMECAGSNDANRKPD